MNIEWLHIIWKIPWCHTSKKAWIQLLDENFVYLFYRVAHYKLIIYLFSLYVPTFEDSIVETRFFLLTMFSTTLFRNKRFMLDEMTYRNASNFAIFLEFENPHSFFLFSFHATTLLTRQKVWAGSSYRISTDWLMVGAFPVFYFIFASFLLHLFFISF